MTWLAHSSVAMVLLIMSLTSVGLVPILLGCVLVLGANVGSGLIPLILTLHEAPEARRIPSGNFLFRLLGALLALAVLSQAVSFSEFLDTPPARQIANFHTLFNGALALMFLPLTGITARLTGWILPDVQVDVTADDAPLEPPSHLDPELIDKPKLALACATREVLRMANRVESMLRYAIDMFQADSKRQVGRLGKIDDDVDQLNTAIKLYLTEVSRNQLSEADSRRCMEIMTFTITLEHIGDIIVHNLLEQARKKLKSKHEFSEQGWQELTAMHARVVENMQSALNVFVSNDRESARLLIEAKEKFRDLEYNNKAHHLARLRAGQVASIGTSAIPLDMMRDLKQVNSHLSSVASPMLHSSGALLKRRLKNMSVPKSRTSYQLTARDIESA